ncbi:hypothetical protein [Glycomyces tritici]|uniref:DUF4878 domain-containing protein n=1 Tax=Glycomyces tritici TaxID=2665176 RepID=A0ABT7YKL1_9ACTN|nr:hypothetical protein [Glycomyces tritici]MDN3238803.1 hypothetical protein [Glycomyces tritici]
MTDRPNPQGPAQDRGPEAERDPAAATAQEPAAPEAASPEPDAAAQASPLEPLPVSVPIEPIPLEPTPPLPTSTAGPAPEPESPQSREPVQAEPHTSIAPVAEPSAPAQIAPDSGAPPIPMEPEPSVPDHVSPDQGAPVALMAETEATLALPPTTKEVEPPPVPSSPPPPTGVPVPFAAPPTGHSRFFGAKLGFGIAGSALAVIIVAVAVVFAVFVFMNSVTEKVEGTAEDFVGAIAEDDWDTAYAMLCDSYRERPVGDYTDEWEGWDAEGAEVQDMNPSTGNVTVEFADGSAIELTIAIEQTSESLSTSVCGWRSVTV